MSDRILLTDTALRAIYAVLPQGHRVSDELHRARDPRSAGHLSRAEAREVARRLASACYHGHDVVSEEALRDARDQLERALVTLDAKLPDGVTLRRQRETTNDSTQN